MDKVFGILIIGLVMAVVFGLLTGWLLMLVLGAILGAYGIAGPGFFVSWALAAVLSIVANSSVEVK